MNKYIMPILFVLFIFVFAILLYREEKQSQIKYNQLCFPAHYVDYGPIHRYGTYIVICSDGKIIKVE